MPCMAQCGGPGADSSWALRSRVTDVKLLPLGMNTHGPPVAIASLGSSGIMELVS